MIIFTCLLILETNIELCSTFIFVEKIIIIIIK